MADDLDIAISPVPQPEIVGNLARGQLAYDIYTVEVSFRGSSGTLQLPVADEPDTPADIVRTHAPYKTKVVKWVVQTVCPIGMKPTLPHWDTGDPNEVCCYQDIQPQAPVLTSGGNAFIWRVEGEYHYQMRSANLALYPAGACPNSVLSAENFTLTEADFSKDVLRSNAAASPPSNVAFDTSIR